jgi:radical SAM superfamily enzyme YgiQ (UPF0313 family)
VPHVTFVPLTGLRIGEQRLLELGMSLPGLAPREKAVGQLPALGLLTLAGMLPEQWSCSYLPTTTANRESINRIISDKPDLVAVSALTASIQEAYELCDKLRLQGISTVIGGLHASALPSEAQAHADAVVVGRGEAAWPRVLEDAARGGLRREYWSSAAAFSKQSPRFDLLGSTPPRFTVQTQTGCPLACDFCAASRMLGPFQEKPVGAIELELAAIRAIDSRPLVELADDNTFAGRRDPAELFQVLRQAQVRYFTECDWRIGERQDVLSGLAQSGCAQVLIGIESLVFRYPGMGQKWAELERVMAAIKCIQDAGVPVNGCFIVGAEGETRDSINRLVQFILDSPLAEVQLTMQTPFPGTALYRRLRSDGRLLAHRGWPFYTLFDVTFQPDALTVRELEAGFEHAIKTVFSRTATERRNTIRRRILKSRHSPSCN